MVTVPPLQTSKTVSLLRLLLCSSSYFTVDSLNFSCLFFPLSVVWLWLFSLRQKSRRDVGNFDKEFTKMAVELTPTDKLFIMNLDQNEFQGFSYNNPEFIIQVWGVPQRLGSRPATYRLVQHPIARSPHRLRLHQNLNWTTSTHHTCRYFLSMALDAGFSVGPVDRPAMVSKSALLQGNPVRWRRCSRVYMLSRSTTVCAWFSPLWPLAPWTFHDQYVRYVFTRVSAGCSWKDPERTDVLPESVLILVSSSKWHKKRQRSPPRHLSDCDIRQSLFNLCFYGTVCAVG